MREAVYESATIRDYFEMADSTSGEHDVVSMFDLPKVRSRLPETSQASHSVMLIRSLVVKGGEVDPTAT
jgi:hypothetical protein